jgi:hypothetical protein
MVKARILGAPYIYIPRGKALFYMEIPTQINLFTEKLQKKGLYKD